MIPSLLSRTRISKTLVLITRNKQETPKPPPPPPPPPINREAVDPVQKLFLDKLREYRQKGAGAKLVDPSPAILKELDKEYNRLYKVYGGGPGDDMVSFPTFKFEEPELDPIDELSPEEKKKKQELEKKKKLEKKSVK